MKPTARNTYGRACLERELKHRPDFAPSSTSSGKVHGGFGIIAEFTNRDACEETLRSLGFAPDRQCGSFTEWAKPVEVTS